jgi:hypothetical protein
MMARHCEFQQPGVEETISPRSTYGPHLERLALSGRGKLQFWRTMRPAGAVLERVMIIGYRQQSRVPNLNGRWMTTVAAKASARRSMSAGTPPSGVDNGSIPRGQAVVEPNGSGCGGSHVHDRVHARAAAAIPVPSGGVVRRWWSCAERRSINSPRNWSASAWLRDRQAVVDGDLRRCGNRWPSQRAGIEIFTSGRAR